MTVVWGVDTDNYDGAVSVDRFRRLYAQGARFNIVSCENSTANPNVTIPQANASKEAGLAVPFSYKFPYWTPNDIEGMKRAAGFGFPVLIDCETETTWTPERVVNRIHECKDALLAEGRYGGIYTGEWWWPGHTRNCQDFVGDIFWHAAYPFGAGKLPPADYLPPLTNTLRYWGNTAPHIWQYADVCYGEPTFDMNACDSNLLGENEMALISPDGSQRIEPNPNNPNQMVLYNQGVAIRLFGSSDGTAAGREAWNYGGVWNWVRHINDDGSWDPVGHLSEVEGD